MKSALILLVSLAAMAFAQDGKAAPAEQKKPVKKLESVTWDLQTHKLVWVVGTGSEVNGEFVPASSDRYEISPDEAVMAQAGEKRGFTEDEAASLHRLLDVLSLYCAESVVWWDQGQGTPIDPQAKSDKSSKHPKETDDGHRNVTKPAPKKTPRLIEGELIASADRRP